MSLIALNELLSAEAALIKALDGDNIDDLEAAVAAFGTSVAAVRATAAWHQTPEVEDGLSRALALVEAARVRTFYLADRNRRRLELLTATVGRGHTLSPAYGRDGRIG